MILTGSTVKFEKCIFFSNIKTEDTRSVNAIQGNTMLVDAVDCLNTIHMTGSKRLPREHVPGV